MKGFFRRLFNIYSGEEKNALLFAGLGFLWSLGVTSGQKFADALFLLHIGADELPTAYIITACAMMIMAAFFLKAFHVIRIHRTFMGVLFVGAIFYGLAYLCLLLGIGTHSKLFWFTLKIFGSVLFTLCITCFWTFIDQYFHLQDAKRLYSLFTSAVFLGLATTGFIMRSGLVDFQNLTLLIMLILLSVCFWIHKIALSVTPIHDEHALETSGDQEGTTFKSLFRSILRSKFTMLLMVGNFLMFLFIVTTEYSYLSAFDHHFAPVSTMVTGGEEHAQLTLFLGQSIASVSIINLIFGLFLYSRIVRRFGVSNLLLCTPLFLLVTFSGWLIDDSTLLFPLMGFFVVEGMVYFIDDNNFTLLLNAVPTKTKYRIRLMIESFFEPTGMLVSSLLLSFAPIDSRKLGLILASCAVVVALLLRKQYLKAIYLNLAENAIHFQRSVRDWFAYMSKKEQRSVERRLLAILYRGNEQAQLLAVQGLLDLNDPSIMHRLLQRTNNFSLSGKLAFIEMLSLSNFSEYSEVIDHFRVWLAKYQDPNLQSALQFYLARLGYLCPTDIARDLESSDLTRKGTAIISLKKSENAIRHLTKLLQSEDENDVCMATTILSIDASPQDIETLLPFLKSPFSKIARAAAASIAQISNPSCRQYAAPLIHQLTSNSDTEVRQSCLRALGRMEDPSLVKPIISSSIHFRPNERRLTELLIYQLGSVIVPTLLEITSDISMHDRCRMLSGRILGRIDLSTLRAHLHDIVSIEIDRASFYYYHAHTLQTKHPDIDITLLQKALLASFHSALDFIIQLLGVAGESADCELLSRSLRSSNPKVRSQVVETLERTCENKIFRDLYPLIADLPHADKMRAYEKEGHKPLSLSELLDKMAQSSILNDKLFAIALQYRLKLPQWRENLNQQLLIHKEIFQQFAYELLEA